MSVGRITPQHVPKSVVPENFYSSTQIAEFEKISKFSMREMATSTLRTLAELAKKENLVDKYGNIDHAQLPRLFNTIKFEVCTDITVNAFLSEAKLAPFAHMFRLYFKQKMAAENDVTLIFYGDFGIKKSIYERYKETGKVYDYSGRGKYPKYDKLAQNGRSAINFPDGGRVDVPQNAIFLRFKKGIERCNKGSDKKVTIPEMTISAIQEFMDSRENIFGEQEFFIDEKKLTTKKSSEMRVSLDRETIRLLDKFLQRYNKTHTPAIMQVDFMRMAIRSQLERMPLELVDPKLVLELKKTNMKI